MISQTHSPHSRFGYAWLALIVLIALPAHRSLAQDSTASAAFASGLLISSATGMETAWEIPKNPLSDSLLPRDKRLAEQVRLGYAYFTKTPEAATRLSGNNMTCSNCHLNAGQRDKALPLAGISGLFPEYNKRQVRMISLEDRIVGCFERSMNSTGRQTKGSQPASRLSGTEPEVLAIASYITWLSEGVGVGEKPSWRGHNVLSQEQLIPVHNLDPEKGRKLYVEKCTNCHGDNGQGVEIGDKKAGPLWGDGSWNDGAGAARVYTLAGMIRYMMPYLDPGSLTDEEAQHIAAYITSKKRPKFPYKAADYRTEPLPVDAVYYKR